MKKPGLFLVDKLNVNSADGKFMLIKYREVMKVNAFTAESSNWSAYDLIVYCSLCGCDFIPRLFGQQEKDIEAFMTKWVRSTSEIGKDNLLQSICYKNCWPNEHGKGKGETANDFPQKLKTGVQFMKYAPVIRDTDLEVGRPSSALVFSC